jgi:hypothetical protein
MRRLQPTGFRHQENQKTAVTEPGSRNGLLAAEILATNPGFAPQDLKPET